MNHWYAIHTLPHVEKAVAISLEERGLRIFLPMLSQGKRNGKPVPPQPLFPSYLFCYCNLADVSFASLRWTPGLRRIVGFGGEPAIVPDRAIEFIRQQLEAMKSKGGPLPHPFQPGDEVLITSGAFAGLAAIFEGPMRPSERVTVLLNTLNQVSQLRLSLSPADLTPSSRPPRRTRGRGRWIQSRGSPARPGIS